MTRGRAGPGRRPARARRRRRTDWSAAGGGTLDLNDAGVPVIDLTGKTVLVTGATDGIGKATAEGLARLGARVLVHGRDAGRVAAAVKLVAAAGPGGAEGLVADLSVQAEVRRLAAEGGASGRLDVLVNNAGVFMSERRVTADGMETTLAVNVLAPFLLSALLLDVLRAAAPSRIVNVSSMTHKGARLDPEHLQGRGHWDGVEAYGASKLALTLLTTEMAARLAGSGVTVNSLHPGVVRTKLLRAGWQYPGSAGDDPERGARTSIYVACAPELEHVSGAYFSGSGPATASPLVKDRQLRRRLWEVCAGLVGLPEDLWQAGLSRSA